MRKQFPLYYHLTEDEKRDLFNSKDCYFVFDTNALLDIYRLGKETAEKVLHLLDKFKSRIIIPRHVALEYHNHMLDIITEFHSIYNNFLNQNNRQSLLDSISSSLKIDNTPSLKRKMIKCLGSSIDSLFDEVRGEKDYMLSQFKTWELQNKLSDALGPVLLPGFDKATIECIEKDGADRYSKQIPPGFLDGKDKDTNIYGDLIIWKEILEFAKTKECSIILIGRDMKDDWLQRLHGMICGPRQELLEEFNMYSPSGKFHIYTLDQFLEFANEEDKVLDESELSEVKELASQQIAEKSGVTVSKISIPTKKSFLSEDKSEEDCLSKSIKGSSEKSKSI